MEIHSVKSSILEYLRQAIITGELVDGQKLNEAQLAAKFNISRPPLREAFRTLENEQLISSVPRKGCYVTTLSLQDLDQVFEARLMIELYAIDILKKRNVREVSKIRGVFDLAASLEFSERFTNDKLERLRYLQILAACHSKLVELAENSFLVHFHQTITYNLSRYQNRYPYDPDSFQTSQEYHRLIFNSIKEGNFDEAKDLLRTHLVTFVELLKAKMKQQNSEDHLLESEKRATMLWARSYPSSD